MKLKERKNERFFTYLKKLGKFFYKILTHRKSKIFFLIVFAILFFVIGGIVGLMFTKFFGTFDEPSQKALQLFPLGITYELRLLKTKIGFIKSENVRIPFNYIKGQFSNPERMFIDVSFANFQKIEFKRQQALELGYLDASGEDFVSSTIRYGKEEFKANIRLKGDEKDHWEKDKWSFRIKIKDGKTLNGMKVFSVQKPSTRNYITEFLYHRALKKENLIGLRYNFIEVVINGENKGIYAMEEHFDKELIENNHRQEGVIIKFSEDFTRERRENLRETYDDEKFLKITIEKDIEWFYASEIEVFNGEEINSNEELKRQFGQAKNLLEVFRRQDLQTHEVFDSDKLATYFALNTLFGSPHASDWTNIRFYFNPITSKLEPIGFDLGGGPGTDIVLKEYLPDCISLKKGDGCSKKAGNFEDLVFRDPIFLEKYLNEINRFSKKTYLDEFFKAQRDDIEKFENIIHKNEPIYHFSEEIFYTNQETIKNKLETIDNIEANFVGVENNTITIQVESTNNIPVKILDLNYNGIIFEKIFGVSMLQPKVFGSNKPETFRFSIPENFLWQEEFIDSANISYTLLGSSKIEQKKLYESPYLKKEFLENDFIRQESILSEFEFLEVNERSKSIFIKQGSWALEKSLIIPEGFIVFANEETILDLVNGSTFLSFSSLRFIGTENKPIKIISTDGTGQGLVVLNAGKQSVFKNVFFENLKSPSKQGWNLTGAVTFHESDVKFEKISILGMNSEDSLHLIRSKFEIENSSLKNCSSDCLDIDFGEGLIAFVSLENCGNDCIDFSGSKINITNVSINNVWDKGISVGEGSNVSINNIIVDRGNIAIASKDNSNVIVKNSKISDVNYGLAIYQKKTEFGPASIIADNLQLLNVENRYILEKNSNLLLEGVLILSQEKNVYDKLYGVEI